MVSKEALRPATCALPSPYAVLSDSAQSVYWDFYYNR